MIQATLLDPRQFLARKSFIKLYARERAQALLDEGTYRELLGPFERLKSPWLLIQDVVPQSDDGSIVAREARLGLNGPEVIEEQSGIEEFDSKDRQLVWGVNGGEQRYATGFADYLSNRLQSQSAQKNRRTTLMVRQRLAAEWHSN
jgi:acetyl-CoA carboxylase beta subunit